MPRDLLYPKLPSNTVRRYDNRATYDLYAIHSIVNSTPVLHVSFNPIDDSQGPFPTILPMIGQMGSFAYPSADLEEPLDCYLHGYVTSRIMNLARGGDGFPISIAATKCDGLVLSLTPFSHSYNYRSVVLFGYATLVTDAEEKLWAMELITNSVVPDRWDNVRTPPDSGELSSSSVLKVRIVSGSGKIRDGEPHDDKKDLRRDEIVDNVWTGVIPMWDTMGEAVASKSNRVKEVPDYISSFRTESNRNGESYARRVASDH